MKVTVWLLALCFILTAGCTGSSDQAKHDHSSDDIDRHIRKLDHPGRDKWQKPDEVIKRMNLKNGDRVAPSCRGRLQFIPMIFPCRLLA